MLSTPLPARWVDAIFDRLSVRYGRSFLDRWSGLDMAAVKQDWAVQLAGLQDRPEAIKHALENLPTDFPPTVGQFRDVCSRAPQYAKALPAPQADEAVKGDAIVRLQEMFEVGHAHDPKAWARRLKARHESGERLNRYQVACYREALGERRAHLT